MADLRRGLIWTQKSEVRKSYYVPTGRHVYICERKLVAASTRRRLSFPQKCASLIIRESFGHVRIEILFRAFSRKVHAFKECDILISRGNDESIPTRWLTLTEESLCIPVKLICTDSLLATAQD